MGKKLFIPLLIASALIFLAIPYIKGRLTNLNSGTKTSAPAERLSPIPTLTELISPPLPGNFTWTKVPASQIKTNKGVLFWTIDLRECNGKPGKATDNCLYPDKFYTSESDLPGSEWVSYRRVASPEQIVDTAGLLMAEQAQKINWSLSEYQVKPGYKFTPNQGAQSATYQPTCIYGLSDDKVRVACLTTIISEDNTTGEGAELRYIYPLTKEFRYFISDPVSISSLLSQIKLE